MSKVPEKPDKLMTIDEAAHYLDIHRGTLYRWSQCGKVPVSKIGRIWRFKKEKLDEWIDSQAK